MNPRRVHLDAHVIVSHKKMKEDIKKRTAEIACLLMAYAFLCGCKNISPTPAERVASIQKEILEIEVQCVPKKGTARQDVEKIFGAGEPLYPTESKTPHKGNIPADSPRRVYQLCDNGTLTVSYDTGWKVLHSSYFDPYSSKGRALGMTITNEELLLELEPRLNQMKRILKEYKKRKYG